MNLIILMLTLIVHVMDATKHLEHEIETLKHLVLQEASEIATIKNKAKDDERLCQQLEEEMKERFQQLIEEQVQQASEIAALKKKVEDGDNTVNALKENHRKEMELVRKGLQKLDKILTVASCLIRTESERKIQTRNYKKIYRGH